MRSRSRDGLAEAVILLDVAATGRIVALGLLEIVSEIDRRLIPVDRVLLEAAMHQPRELDEEWPA